MIFHQSFRTRRVSWIFNALCLVASLAAISHPLSSNTEAAEGYGPHNLNSPNIDGVHAKNKIDADRSQQSSQAVIRIENLTKIPGTDRGFPAENFFTFHRTKALTNSAGQMVGVHDRNDLRIHNDGTSPLHITGITTTNTDNFIVTGVDIPTDGLYVAPGQFIDVTVVFLTERGGGKQVVTEYLVLDSNAANAQDLVATFRGAYMRRIEGGNEINAQQVFDAFGFGTQMGRDESGNVIVRPSSDYPSNEQIDSGSEGDMILSKYFVAADPTKPVKIMQIAAFHSPGEAGISLRLRRNRSTGVRYFHNELYHQTLLPKSPDDLSVIANGSNIISDSFYVSIANYRTTGGGPGGSDSDEILGVRTYRVIDNEGNVVPNEYLLNQDYIGNGCGQGSNNCDWNDNTSYLINARPVAVPSAGVINDTTVSPLVEVTYDVAASFDNGYPGNRLLYTATLVDGTALPDWISLDQLSGKFTLTAPAGAVDGALNIQVTATDYNLLTATASFVISVGTPQTGGQNEFWLEAECAQVGDNWTTEPLTGASAGEVVFLPQGGSSSVPPADIAANRVRFLIDDVEAGSYHLFARVRGDGSRFDSFWVRVNDGSWKRWFWRSIDPSGLVWEEVFDATIQLGSGLNEVDFAFREKLTYLDKIHLNQTGIIPANLGVVATNCDNEPVNQEAFWLEAECATVGSGFITEAHPSASAGEVVYRRQGSSSSEPPADIADNRVRFTVETATPEAYRLFARVRGDGSKFDSFWVRVNGGDWFLWFWRTTDPSGLVWNEVFDAPVALTAGTNFIDFAFREERTYLDKIHLTRTGEIPMEIGEVATNCGMSPGGQETFWLEAECATVGEGWVVGTHPAASAGRVVYWPDGFTATEPPLDIPANRVRFSINGAAAGEYHLFARVRGDGAKYDSFWIRVNGSPWQLWFWRTTDPQGLVWNEVINSPFILQEGTNEIDFAYRERLTFLDKIHLNQTGISPAGTGLMTAACDNEEGDLRDVVRDISASDPSQSGLPAEEPRKSVAPVHSTIAGEDLSDDVMGSNDDIFVFPNPAVEELHFRLTNNYQGKMNAFIRSVDGKTLRRVEYNKGVDVFRGTIGIQGLPTGTYLLQVVGPSWRQQSVFLKVK